MLKTKILLRWACMALFLTMKIPTVSFCQMKDSIPELTMPKQMKFSNGKWKDITARAKKENKYIFVDAFTTWCSPCRKLKNITFKDEATSAYFNAHFINYTVDMEKGEGIELAEKWNVNEYPTLLFFAPDGKLAKKYIGYVDGKHLIDLGKDVLAEDSKK